jgi:hypothetical protein
MSKTENINNIRSNNNVDENNHSIIHLNIAIKNIVIGRGGTG